MQSSRCWVGRASLLALPASVLAGAWWGLWVRGPGYDAWKWLAIGAFNGLVVGGLLAVALRVARACVGQRG